MGDQKNKLFVGGLPPEVTTDELQMVFGTYGNCTDCHIMQGRSTSGQACAFVVYDNAEAANSAIGALDGVYSFRQGPPIKVSWAKPPGSGGGKGAWGSSQSYGDSYGMMGQWGSSWEGDWGYGGYKGKDKGKGKGKGKGDFGGYKGKGKGDFGGGYKGNGKQQQSAAAPGTKLFVGNLPPDIQQEAIRMVFEHYGKVTNVHIMQGRSNSGQACAFVEYASPGEAETAIITLNDKYEIRPGEGNIMVKYASSTNGPKWGPY